jgi:hypothetical protein
MVAVIVERPEDPRVRAEPVRCDLETVTAADVRALRA